MSNSEQKFKVGDKVKRTTGDFRNVLVGCIYTVSEVLSTGAIRLYGHSGSYDPEFFEIYMEKEKPSFDLHSNPWYIRVENEEQFNLANKWLKENFGKHLFYPYDCRIKSLTNVCSEGYINNAVMWSDVESFSKYKDTRPEIKLTYKTSISSVEYPVVEIETEQQKRIRELKETIDSASKQLEELMKETK